VKKWRAKHSKEPYVVLSKGIIEGFYDKAKVTGFCKQKFYNTTFIKPKIL